MEEQKEEPQSDALIGYFINRFESSNNKLGCQTMPPSPAPTRQYSQRPSVCSAMAGVGLQPDQQPRKRFYSRVFRWFFKSKKHKNQRRMSTEIHAKRKHATSTAQATSIESQMLEDNSSLLQPTPVVSVTSTARNSWADILIPMQRRTSRTLAPPPSNMSSSKDLSLESGYHSHSSLSTTPITPWRKGSSGRIPSISSSPRHLNSKSMSVEGGAVSSPPYSSQNKGKNFMNWRSVDNPSNPIHAQNVNKVGLGAKEKRRQFRQENQTFRQVVEDTSEVDTEVLNKNVEQNLPTVDKSTNLETLKESLGEWWIPHNEIVLGKKLVEGGKFGHNVISGKWHGDVVIHTFAKTKDFIHNINCLTQIRHENIVLYMGASMNDDKVLSIITNQVKANSLYNRLKKMTCPSVAEIENSVTIAKQLTNAVGYLHAKDIIHGRISSKNVFLDSKVQLSLLDYAVGHPNTVYTSPQVLSKSAAGKVRPYKGGSKADDVFAFGTLLYEIFTGHLPLISEPEDVIEACVRSGGLAQSLSSIPCTERLKKLIQKCWDSEASKRPSFAQMVPHFSPGNCLLRRHSTSEPRLDQMEKPGKC